MGVIKYGKFVFENEELILDEYELVQLLRLCKLRNRALYHKFVKFYALVVSEGTQLLFDEVKK